MNCINCNKKFKKPLNLFNGERTCPHCKKKLTELKSLYITEENEGLYNLSEVYYLRYLSPDSYSLNNKKALAYTPAELLENAVKYCEESAKLGNPKAIYKMGYYNEFYLETEKSETDKIRIAFDYYSYLCYSSDVTVQSDGIAKGITKDEFSALKRNSAEAIVNLMNKYQVAFKGVGDYAKKYDMKANFKKIKSIYGDIVVDNTVVTVNQSSKIKSKQVQGVLKSCFGKDRVPLFGLYFLSFEEIKKVFSKDDGDKKKQDFVKFLKKGFNVGITECDANGELLLDNDGYFTDYNEQKLKAFLENDSNLGKYFYLYFYNSKGKRTYLKKYDVAKTQNDLIRNEYALIKELINFGMLEYLFFEDDIVQFKNAEKLINYVCTGVNE